MNDLKLQVFVMAARLLNFSQTAKRFGISQPAVTKRIHELEEDVKVRLFERAGSKLLLTREGEVFLKYAEQILESYEALNTRSTRRVSSAEKFSMEAKVIYLLGSRMSLASAVSIL